MLLRAATSTLATRGAAATTPSQRQMLMHARQLVLHSPAAAPPPMAAATSRSVVPPSGSGGVCWACLRPLRLGGSSSRGAAALHQQPWGGSGRQQHTPQPLTRAASSSSSPQEEPSSTQPPAEAGSAGGGSQPSSQLMTLPTMLTLARVAAIPALIAVWFWQDPSATVVATGLFVAASLTDWLDGYLARKLNASTPFGAFLDPVADKLMVAAVLILLSTQPLAAGPCAGNAWLVPVATLVIIGREITMSALREWAATMGPAARAAVAVNALGKWKTASQMVALTCLLLTRDGAHGQLGAAAAAAGAPLLGVAAYLTAHSLAVYFAGLWRFMK